LRAGHELPEFPQLSDAGLRRIAGDDGGVDGADRDAGDPIGSQIRFGEAFIDAGRRARRLASAAPTFPSPMMPIFMRMLPLISVPDNGRSFRTNHRARCRQAFQISVKSQISANRQGASATAVAVVCVPPALSGCDEIEGRAC
jgi:hypothetical protein